MKIEVVDSHHKVLQHWASCRRELGFAPKLLTLDHHTDTSKPFRRAIGRIFTAQGEAATPEKFNNLQQDFLQQLDYRSESAVNSAISDLNNDEHIVAAIQTDIISLACVIAHSARATDLATFHEHNIICSPVPDVKFNEAEVRDVDGFEASALEAQRPDMSARAGKTELDYDCVLETWFLQNKLDDFNEILNQASQPPLLEGHYILDIDLDYFNTFKSIEPKNSDLFRRLIDNASLVTIATEPDYVKACAVDKDLSSEYLLQKILRMSDVG